MSNIPLALTGVKELMLLATDWENGGIPLSLEVGQRQEWPDPLLPFVGSLCEGSRRWKGAGYEPVFVVGAE